MTDFREEAYILEKVEISEDEEDDGFRYEEIKDTDQLEISGGELDKLEDEEEDDDLDNFEALKAKTTIRMIQQQSKSIGGAGGDLTSMKTYKPEPKPRVLEREVVIDDFIRNFLQKFAMGKTLGVFQQEWYELQKKGTFHDTHIGLITDIENKNKRLRDKVERMKRELAEAQVVANQAKSTWELLRKERDFHKTH